MMNPLIRRLVLVTALAGCVSFTACDRKETAAPVGSTESEEDRDAAIRDAFASDEEVATAKDATEDAALRKEIDAFFTDLGKAYREVDIERYLELVSARSIAAYAEKSGFMKFGTDRKRAEYVEGMEKGFRSQFHQAAPMSAFDEHVVRRLDAIRDNEVVAYVRMLNHGDGIYTKMRWWLLRGDDGQWRAYDFESLDQNIRASVILSAISADAEATLAYTEALLRIVSQRGRLSEGDLGEAELKALRRDVEDVLRADPPTSLALFAHRTKSQILAQQGKYDEALAALDTMEKLDPRMAVVHTDRAGIHRINENTDAAIASYTRYAELLGWDPDVCEIVADLYYDKEDLEASAKYARMGLADNPNAGGCLASLAAALPDGQMDEVLAAIKLTKEPEDAYDYVLTHLLDKELSASAKAVYAALKAALPESELIEAYAEDFAETPAKAPVPD